jgi:hypothetical protein
MSNQLMMPTIAYPSFVLDVLEKHHVELMIFDSHQDSNWIRFFKGNPGYEIIVEDHEAVVFLKSDKIQTIR